MSLLASDLTNMNSKIPKPELSEHTLIHFLDRFVYKNPKTKSSSTKGSSIMQPLAKASGAKVLLNPKTGADPSQPLNSEAFWKQKVEAVPADQIFFHQYFTRLGKEGTKKQPKQKGGDEDSSDEDEIWDAVVTAAGGEDVEMDDEDDGLNPDDFMSDEDMDDADEAAEVELLEDEDDLVEFGSDDEDLSNEEEETDSEPVQQVEAVNPANIRDEKDRRKRRKQLKSLPTFASMDDYAAMLESDED
jgi:ribosome biogenesis protein MAK21